VGTYLVYVDDSGDATMSLHSGLFIPLEGWREALTKWKLYRKSLQRKHEVPPEFELYSVLWIPGKDQPSSDPDAPINMTVGLRHEWTKKALQTIAMADSTGSRNELCELLRWCQVSEGLARSAVEGVLDRGQVGSADDAQIGALRQVLA
jgi:hypothetical protein